MIIVLSFAVIKATGLCGKEKSGMRIDIYFLLYIINIHSKCKQLTTAIAGHVRNS